MKRLYFLSLLGLGMAMFLVKLSFAASDDQPSLVGRGVDCITDDCDPVAERISLLHPVLECVEERSTQQFVAHFGYQNDATGKTKVPLGPNNTLLPGPVNRGQPNLFLSGLHRDVFQVKFDGNLLTWRLGEEEASASGTSRPCPLETPIVVPQEELPDSGPSFNTVAGAARWIEARMIEADLGEVRLERNATGKVIGLSGNTASATEDTMLVSSRTGGDTDELQVKEVDRFSTVLGGLRGFITIKGAKVCLRDEGCGVCAGGQIKPQLGCVCPDGFEEQAGDCRAISGLIEAEGVTAFQAPPSSDPKCDVTNRFCTKNQSFKNSYVLYKSIGSETEVTRGGIRYELKACTVVDFIGAGACSSQGDLIISDWLCTCPGVSQQVSCGRDRFNRPSPFLSFGDQIGVWITIGRTVLSLNQVFFFDEPLRPDFRQKREENTNSIESKHFRFRFGLIPEGVCARHGSDIEQDFGSAGLVGVTSKGQLDPRDPFGCRF